MDFGKRDVMVGVLRNRKQLDYNIKYKFYHIPEEWVPKDRFPIKYVALYQPPRLFEQAEAGVYVYGRVTNVELVPRHRIAQIPTNQSSEKLYYKFYVEDWCSLPRPIALGNILPDVNVFTSEYQFFNATDISELFIKRAEHWVFFNECKKHFHDAFLLGKGSVACGVKFNGCIAEWKGEKIIIYIGKKRFSEIKLELVSEAECKKLFEDVKERLK